MFLNRMNKALIFCVIRIIRSPVGAGGAAAVVYVQTFQFPD